VHYKIIIGKGPRKLQPTGRSLSLAPPALTLIEEIEQNSEELNPDASSQRRSE
jgi:hypothetical protein